MREPATPYPDSATRIRVAAYVIEHRREEISYLDFCAAEDFVKNGVASGEAECRLDRLCLEYASCC